MWKKINAKSRRLPKEAIITISKAKYARLSPACAKALNAQQGDRVELVYKDVNTFALRVHNGPNTYKLGTNTKHKVKEERVLIFTADKLKERVKHGDYKIIDESIVFDDQEFRVFERIDAHKNQIAMHLPEK